MLNKSIKEQQKKKKKFAVRTEKKVAGIADVLEGISINKIDEKYDFDEDYEIKDE